MQQAEQSSFHLIIVGLHDTVLFEHDGWAGEPIAFIRQYAAFASLDAVEEVSRRQGDPFLPQVYRPCGETFAISAFVGVPHIRLLLLHDRELTGNPSTRALLSEAYGICAKALLSPFSLPGKPLERSSCERLTALCRGFLR